MRSEANKNNKKCLPRSQGENAMKHPEKSVKGKEKGKIRQG
jgi:hypothetical protein